MLFGLASCRLDICFSRAIETLDIADSLVEVVCFELEPFQWVAQVVLCRPLKVINPMARCDCLHNTNSPIPDAIDLEGGLGLRQVAGREGGGV